MNRSTSLDLFLDESGLFMETSTNPVELAASLKDSRPFPSQLAGVLVPRGQLTTGKARRLLNEALKAGGLPSQPVHATDLPRASYDAVVQSALDRVCSCAWQPVRLVNQEQVSYGDRVANYTNLVAELVLRICERKRLEGVQHINLRIHAARVKIGELPQGELLFLERDEYMSKVQQYLAFAAVRRGLAGVSSAWRLDDLYLRSGKGDPELQICDLFSHASHNKYSPCQPKTASVLADAFGEYDFSLIYRELIQRTEEHLAADAVGLAVLSLAERFCTDNMSADLRVRAIDKLQEARCRLAQFNAPARDQHLAILVSWVEQIIEVRRAAELGHRLCMWLLNELAIPLTKSLSGRAEASSLEWFIYSMHTWALTASNHCGALQDAKQHVGQMHTLLPKLAGQWEHAPLLMRGLVAKGVHLTDCFEHDNASARMEIVAGYYRELGEMFHVVLPDVFPERVRSDMYGRALGTWLQSEILGGLCHGDFNRLEAARELSELAIDEFPAEADEFRQYQYRSQLETAIGDFVEARRFLARSLGLTTDTHSAIATAIRRLNESSPVASGFAQLHWFRLGVTAHLDGDTIESGDFLEAVNETDALNWAWSRLDGPIDYPVHGILRRVAVINALRGQWKPSLNALKRLASLLAGKFTDRVVLQTIRLAAHAEAAVIRVFPASLRFLIFRPVGPGGLRSGRMCPSGKPA